MTPAMSRGARADRAGDGQVADGAVAHPLDGRGLVALRLHVLRDREQDAVAFDDLALVGEVDRRQFEVLQFDVAPDVELGPVGQREHPDLFALLDPPVVERPRLGPLRARVPLAELVAEAQDAFLGPGALLVAAGATEGGVELAGIERVEQGAGLLPVARRPGTGVGDPAGVDGLLHRADDQLVAVLAEPAVAELDHFVEVVAGVDVQHRERQAGTAERPSPPGEAARSSPCPRRTAAPAAAARRRPRG